MEYNLGKQHEKGKLHAIERITKLCDKGSFVEIYSGVKHNCTSFGMEKKDIPYDGVITGFGTVNGKKVAVYAQDFTVQGGSLGNMHGEKIAELIDKAIQYRCPVIGINDSGGARIQEGVDSLCGYGDLFYQNVRASGSVPQISIIAGPCAGGAVYSPGITDFIFAVDKISQLFITGPKVVKSVMFMDISAEDLGGASIHSQKSGVAHFRCENEEICYEQVRHLLDYIPHYYGEDLTQNLEYKYNLKEKAAHIQKILPENSKQGYDMKDVINDVLDDGSFFETCAEFAVNCVTGFGKIEGKTVGIIGNNPEGMGGVLDCDASDKIARHVRYCDAFDIPLVNFVDVPGFIPGPQEERNHTPRCKSHIRLLRGVRSESNTYNPKSIRGSLYCNVLKTSWRRLCVRMAYIRDCCNGCGRSGRNPLRKGNERSFKSSGSRRKESAIRKGNHDTAHSGKTRLYFRSYSPDAHSAIHSTKS